MDEEAVRERAQAFSDALQAGDIGRAAQEMSRELQSNLGELVAMLPLPLTAATIESVETAGAGYLAVLHLVGEGSSMRLQTRWKERDEEPTMVEASRLQEASSAPDVDASEDEAT